MRSWLWKGMLGAMVALPALSGAARAQGTDLDGCSNATLQGDYASSIQGEILGIVTGTPPNETLHPFATPSLINAVAMAHFDGAGHATMVDFGILNGTALPGQTDPTTGFRINETGTYTVFPDCTGMGEIDFPPRPGGAIIKVRFVLARQGREVHEVTYFSHVPAGPSAADGTTCLFADGGCDTGNNVRADAVKLGLGEGERLGLGVPNIQ